MCFFKDIIYILYNFVINYSVRLKGSFICWSDRFIYSKQLVLLWKKYVYRDDEDGDVIKETLKDIIAPKWMIDYESFFLLVGYSNRMTIKVFVMNNIINECSHQDV